MGFVLSFFHGGSALAFVVGVVGAEAAGCGRVYGGFGGKGVECEVVGGEGWRHCFAEGYGAAMHAWDSCGNLHLVGEDGADGVWV